MSGGWLRPIGELARTRVHRRKLNSWLAALADPEGKVAPPRSPLRADQLAKLWSLAERHGVLPSAIANAKRLTETGGAERLVKAGGSGQSCGEVFSASLTEARKRAFRFSAATLSIRRQFAELADGLSAMSVPPVLLKGADFASRLYPAESLRTFGDIDLLVSERSRSDAERILTELGYAAGPDQMKYGGGYGEVTFRLEDRASATVELHWDLVNSPTVRRGISVRYEDLQLVRPDGQTSGLPVPSPGSLLLISCVHAATGHAFDRLQLLCDICQAARERAGRIDVEWLRQATNATGSRLAVSLGLSLAGKILGEPLCFRLARRLGLRGPGLAGIAVSPGVVMRCHHHRDSWRRQLLRELLKRSR